MRQRDDRKNRREIANAFSMISQIGLAMLVCMGVSLGIGYYMDKMFGTKCFVIIMLIIGMLAALRSMLVLTGAYHPGQPKDGDKGEQKDEDSQNNID